MVCADETMELWRPPNNIFLNHLVSFKSFCKEKLSSHTCSFLVVIARVGLDCDTPLCERGRRIDTVYGPIGAVGDGQVLAEEEGVRAGRIDGRWTRQAVLATQHVPDAEHFDWIWKYFKLIVSIEQNRLDGNAAKNAVAKMLKLIVDQLVTASSQILTGAFYAVSCCVLGKQKYLIHNETS